MLPFLTKNNEAAGPITPAWHPNFRDYERLPDTKVVRTSFFINGAAVLVAVAVLLAFAFQEFKLAALRSQIADWSVQIEADKAASGQAVTKFRRFQEEEKKINEVDTFLQRQIVFSDFLLRLGQGLPKNIAITSVDHRETGVTLRAVVRGAPELASGEASAYVEQLRNDEQVGPLFENVALTNLSRDPVTGRLVIEVFLKFKPATPAAPAKK
ncbi:MAG TPA: hypothetical protein VGD81_14930 [Opitutaceae bacterium]